MPTLLMGRLCHGRTWLGVAGTRRTRALRAARWRNQIQTQVYGLRRCWAQSQPSKNHLGVILRLRGPSWSHHWKSWFKLLHALPQSCNPRALVHWLDEAGTIFALSRGAAPGPVAVQGGRGVPQSAIAFATGASIHAKWERPATEDRVRNWILSWPVRPVARATSRFALLPGASVHLLRF